jgi:hypothetical protein
MTIDDPDVKTPSRQFADWLDHHSRTGWYVAAWAFLITVNQLVSLF